MCLWQVFGMRMSHRFGGQCCAIIHLSKPEEFLSPQALNIFRTRKEGILLKQKFQWR